jgi:nitroreductase
MSFNSTQVNIIDVLNRANASDKLSDLVKFACIAPSSHNTQPWKFHLTNNELIIYPEFSRELHHSDPNDRFLFISLGATIKNIELASTDLGYKYELNFNFASPKSFEAKFTFSDLNITNPNEQGLLSLKNRQTNRNPYTKQPLPTDFYSMVNNLNYPGTDLFFAKEQTEKDKIIEVTNQAVAEAYADKEFRKELSIWITPSLEKYELGMPGYTILVPFLFSFILPWIIKNFNVTKLQQKMHKDWINNTSACAIISGEDNIQSWINTGRLFEEIAVIAESQNIKTAVIGATTQIGNCGKTLAEKLNIHNTPLLMFRIGYAKRVPKASPRLQINKVTF